jgi:hypothetical protein
MRTVASGVLFTSNESLWVEEAPVCAGSDFIDDVGFQINVKGARYMFAWRRLREERAEAVIVGRGWTIEDAAIGLQDDLQ